MTVPIAPEDRCRAAFEAAVRKYWSVRAGQAQRQAASGNLDAGTRGEVTGGAHLDAMTDLVELIFTDEGVPPELIHRGGRGVRNIPGFLRPVKNWDLLVKAGDVLVAAVEFKSQVGPSFGNNANNRAEEAVGNAVDLHRSYEAGLLGPLKPWVGYVMFLEEAQGSTHPVKIPNMSPYTPDPAFGDDPSYKKRYEMLLRRLVSENQYDAACFVTSSAEPDAPIDEPHQQLDFRSFSAAIAARVFYVQRLGLMPRQDMLHSD